MTNGSSGQSGFEWENWAGNVKANPAYYFKPDTVDDLIAIVKQANSQTPKQKIRVVGSSHSWSALAQTDGYMVDLENFNWINIDRDTALVTVGAGALMMEVEAQMKANGLAIPANAVTLMPRIGGLVAAGCHGSGYDYSIISDYVQAVSIVLASGEIQTFSVDELGEDSDLMNAVRLNLGTFGIMYEIVLKAIPTFNVHCVDSTPDMKTTIDNIQDIVTGNNYVEIFWFPFNPDNAIWLKTWNQIKPHEHEEVSGNAPKEYWERIEKRDFTTAELLKAFEKMTANINFREAFKEAAELIRAVQPGTSGAVEVDDPKRHSTALSELLLCLGECAAAGGNEEEIKKCMEGCLKEGGENVIGEELWAFIAEHPSLTPKILPLLWHLVPDRDDYVAEVNDVMHFRRFFPKVALMAMAIPIDPNFENIKAAWNLTVQAVNELAASGQFPLNVNIEARFVKNSNCLISPINGSDHFCIIEVISYITTPTFNDFYAMIGQEWLKLGYNGIMPRPHWPKQFDAIPNINQSIRQAYGDNLKKFLQ
ncbi:MAG TPA: FAD-binding protein, partial [Anaerolineales bacterium]|nr:FAD-binding protein [Anaerolineales bacterium]